MGNFSFSLVFGVFGGRGGGGGGGDFRGYAAFVMQRRVVDASHVEDDGAERLN